MTGLRLPDRFEIRAREVALGLWRHSPEVRTKLIEQVAAPLRGGADADLLDIVVGAIKRHVAMLDAEAGHA